MHYISLYRKYRPQIFSEIVGQENIIKSLQNSIHNKTFTHAYIFSGPHGTGKTTTAKIFARSINCLDFAKNNDSCKKCRICLETFKPMPIDIIEIDAASNNGVDEIRQLREKIKLLPNITHYKVYIIDEVHMLSNSAFNALLKTLEEPPEHVVFVLATTAIYKIPLTILSRCQRFNFTLISKEKIVQNIVNILTKEKIKFELSAIEEIALLAEGSIRDSLSILEQVIALDAQYISLENVGKSFKLLSSKEKIAFVRAVFANDKVKILKLKNKVVENAYDINYFMIGIIKILKEMIEDNIFNHGLQENYDQAIKLLDLVTQYNTIFENVNNPILYFEIFIIKLISEFEPTLKTDPKVVSTEIISAKPLKLNAEVVVPLQSKTNNNSIKHTINPEISKFTSNEYKADIDYKYTYPIFKAQQSKTQDKIFLNTLKNQILKTYNKDFLFFYSGAIPIANESGFIIYFNDQCHVNYLNSALANAKKREFIFKTLNLRPCYIIAINKTEFTNIKNNASIIMKLNKDEKFDIINFYSSLYQKKPQTTLNKIHEIFGNINIE